MMSKFNRKIATHRLGGDFQPPAWLLNLLRRWQPAGYPLEKNGAYGPRDLRLAVRNGYFNLYSGGQSIAKVDLTSRTLRARSHVKYMSSDAPNVQKMGILEDTHSLDEIIDRASRWQGVEKLFVEALVAANALVVDLEIALPGSELTMPDETIVKVAPRIDLAALEPAAGGWRLVFWEVKMSKDDRVRSKNKPEVIAQLQKYTEWFARPGYTDAVLAAYRTAIRDMVALHDFAVAKGCVLNDLDPALRDIAVHPGKLLRVAPQVGLIIGMIRDANGAVCDDPKFKEHCLDHIQSADIPSHVVKDYEFGAKTEGLTLPLIAK